jgi:hypothetical protein
VKVTLIVQFTPTPSDAPQVFVCANGALVTIDEMPKAAVPEFVRVTGSDWLVVPTTCELKLNVVTESEALGDVDETLVWFPTDAPPQP